MRRRGARLHNPDSGQYCSFKYQNAILDRFQVSFSLASAQWIIAHFAFDAAGVPAMAARYHPFFEEFVKYSLMKARLLLRGE
jgi:hypothetical protein